MHHDPAPDAAAQAHGYAAVFDVAIGFYALAVVVTLVVLVADRRRASRSTLSAPVVAAPR